MKLFCFIQIYETRIINGMVPLFMLKLCLNSFLTSDWSQQIQWDWWCRAIIIKIWKLSLPSIEILFYFHYFWTMCTKVWRFVVCVPLLASKSPPEAFKLHDFSDDSSSWEMTLWFCWVSLWICKADSFWGVLFSDIDVWWFNKADYCEFIKKVSATIFMCSTYLRFVQVSLCIMSY